LRKFLLKEITINNNNKQMVNYQDGKIYEIICNKTKRKYIGSTCCKYLSQRLRGHKSKYKQYLNGNKNALYTSFEIIKNNDFEINLIESFPCDSKDELLKRERYWIQNLECVNKHMKIERKEQRKILRLKNLEKESERHKKYYIKNRERLLENSKKTAERRGKKDISEYNKKYKIYRKSWGGDWRFYNNLLLIDVNLFA
jgi:hypothetical protein